eukprot:COSAG04_NODE_1287_length_7366_cov_18.273153_2_plen_89_part_00
MLFSRVRFAFAFFLLLPQSSFEGPPGMALLSVYATMLGAGFSLDTFTGAPGAPVPHPTVGALAFVGFMFIVAIVLLNAVIAIMVRNCT